MAVRGVAKGAPDIYDRLYKTGVEGIKFVSKVSSLHDKVLKLASVYASVPEALSQITVTFRSLKIFTGIRAIPKLYSRVMTAITPGELSTRLLAAWGVVGSTKKVVGAVDAIFYYLNQLHVIDKAALAWTTIAGYIFLPVSIISTAIQGYQFGKRVDHMHSFSRELHTIKQDQTANKAKRLCSYLLSQQNELKTYKVITNACPLKERLTSILERLEAGNKEAESELRHIKHCIKNRMRERAGVAGTKTVLSTGGIVASVLSLACPPAAVALAVVAVVMGVCSLATFVYSRAIPNGDFTENEKQLLFTRIHKFSTHLMSKISSKIKVS